MLHFEENEKGEEASKNGFYWARYPNLFLWSSCLYVWEPRKGDL